MAVSDSRPTKSKQITQITDADLESKKQDLGWIGNFFGSKENAPVYIAGMIGFLALAGAIVIAVVEPTNSSDKADNVKGLLAIVISALSFIGGASGRSK